MSPIVLSTLNAKYIHSAVGLRYLYANMQSLQDQTQIMEFTINTRPVDIVETILAQSPSIIGFGVYIWNTRETENVIAMLRQVAPKVTIVLGGPEVSYEQPQSISQYAHYIISGQADLAFHGLCQQILSRRAPVDKMIAAPSPSLKEIRMPYEYYSQEDINNRVLYVEASRGCPFKCEFCLSSLDKTAWPFDLEQFLSQMDMLYNKGARHFKFVDRTFNLKVSTTLKILTFFLEKNDNHLFLHFELIPDFLPDDLKTILMQFPAGTLQFEIGIQSFNENVQALISRKQKNQKSKDNIRWLRQNTSAHLHTDLIFGLPGETLESFSKSFDELVELEPHEIQVGILKRLKGTPLTRHSDIYKMVYSPFPPYNILSNRDCDFFTIQRMNRFARYWDMIGNSGRFKNTIPLILGQSPFSRFLKLSDWLFELTGQTHKISLARLYQILYKALMECIPSPLDILEDKLWQDYQLSGLKSEPDFLSTYQEKKFAKEKAKKLKETSSILRRQARHLNQQSPN